MKTINKFPVVLLVLILLSSCSMDRYYANMRFKQNYKEEEREGEREREGEGETETEGERVAGEREGERVAGAAAGETEGERVAVAGIEEEMVVDNKMSGTNTNREKTGTDYNSEVVSLVPVADTNRKHITNTETISDGKIFLIVILVVILLLLCVTIIAVMAATSQAGGAAVGALLGI